MIIISQDEKAFNNLEIEKCTPEELIDQLGYELVDL